jgi:alpha-amylase
MGVILQATYKFPNGNTVPSPVDGNRRTPWWWDHLAAQANMFRNAGFTAILLPPVMKTSSGAFAGADGYGLFDDYDPGSKNQKFSTPTRFGTREQLQRCTAIMRANGLDVYLDLVLHQRDGGNDFEYSYPGAGGAAGKGRFPKHKTCFVPNVPRDPIAGPVPDDSAFGDEMAPINGLPKDYVLNGLTDAVEWQTRLLDAQGYRIDDTKGLATAFLSHLLSSGPMATAFAVGEYYDGNPDDLNWWVWNSGMNGRSCTFDFSLRFMMQAMCNSANSWDMTQLDHAGFAGRDAMHAVTFVENHDTDLNSPVIWNKALGYAYILTSEGYPCVYYKDYSQDAGCYGLKAALDPLIWIHENLADGPTVFRHKEFQFVVYERTGVPNLLVGLNNDITDKWKTVTVPTGFGPHVLLHDYTGHSGDIWTDGAGNVTLGIPPNSNGAGYVCYSRAGLSRPNAVKRLSTTQLFEGAEDLDIPPAAPGATQKVGRIWCEPGFAVTLQAEGEKDLKFDVLDPSGIALSVVNGTAMTRSRGWHTLRVTSSAQAPEPFRLEATWTGTQTL